MKLGALGSLWLLLGETERMLRGWWNEDFCNINVDSYFKKGNNFVILLVG